MGLLARFQTALQRSTVRGVLVNHKIDMSDQKSREELLRDGAVRKLRKIPADMQASNEDDELEDGDDEDDFIEAVDEPSPPPKHDEEAKKHDGEAEANDADNNTRAIFDEEAVDQVSGKRHD